MKGQAVIIYTLKFIDSNVSNYGEICIETLFSKIMGRIGFFPNDKIIEAVSWGLIDSLFTSSLILKWLIYRLHFASSTD